MKYLAVFLLVCLGLASALPLDSSDLELSEIDEYILNAEGSGRIGERLKGLFERLVERMRKGSQDGKGVRGDLFKKAQDIYDKLKNMRVEISEKFKSIFEDLRNKMSKNSPADNEIDDFSLYAEGGSRAGGRLKGLFERLVERMRKNFEEGKGVRGDLFKKAQDIYDKLKNMKVEVSEKFKSIFEDLRNKMSRNSPADIEIDDFPLYAERSVGNADISNIFDLFKQLKNLIIENLDNDELKAKVEKIFGKGRQLAEQIINMLKENGEKGQNQILDWIDQIIPDKEERSPSEIGGQIKDFFKDLNIDLKERFTKFGEWVKEQYKKGLQKGKSKAHNLKKIAQEFLDETKDLGKDFVHDALDFFKEYKEDLGRVFDVVAEKARKVLEN